MDIKYKKMNENLQNRIKLEEPWRNPSEFACRNEEYIRRNMERDRQNIWRPSYIRDIEKIVHLPFYNRYADKTQVFSFYHNDDITRRALHVQLVSRIARNIGRMLGLNLDLIEAIALGHDIGHTPFGHAGERYLSSIMEEEAGIFFNHNVQSVRVLDSMFQRNVSLQTLDGILCHNGEFEMGEYHPVKLSDFNTFDQNMDACYHVGKEAIESLIPCTLEGCVVRICDMIAYLGKDRQDALIANIIPDVDGFTSKEIGRENALIINNLTVDIIENSYGCDYIRLSDSAFEDLKTAKRENYEKIYRNRVTNQEYEDVIRPMFAKVFYRLRDDLVRKDSNSPIYKHHINFITKQSASYIPDEPVYGNEDPNLIVMDYIASMTDDYFIALYKYLNPECTERVDFKSYFMDLEKR